MILALLCGMCAQQVDAQLVKGDMNDDGVINIVDVNESVNTVLGNRAIQYIQVGGDPYMVDNSRVVGTWYKTKSDHFTLNSDGTTDYVSDYGEVTTWEFLPYQGIIIFYDNTGKPVSWIEVKKLVPGCMICSIYDDGNHIRVLTTEVPTQPVTAIQLSATTLEMQPNEFMPMLTATVLPADADNKEVTWESSDESVVKLSDGQILAMGYGTAVITCRATDGSGVKAECAVTVKKKDKSGKDSVGREYVDLGLPSGVLWATCNVGADKPEESGLYYAWGETKGYAKGESHNFDWSNYKWFNGSNNTLTKYCTSSSDGTVDNKTVLDPEDDAATANWGSGWRMPTSQEIDDLYNSAYTTTEWVTVNGVTGRKITSKSNGNSIFMPAAGYRDDASLSSEGSYGDYWSSSLYTSNSGNAYGLSFDSDNVDWDGIERYYGQSVRAVWVGSE